MKKTITLLLTLLVIAASSFSTTHVVNSLPYTFSGSMMTSQADTIVLGSSRLTSATSGIHLQSTYGYPINDVVLDLRGSTIAFGTAGGDGNYGVRVSGASGNIPYNVKIIGGNILHEPSNATASGNRCVNITTGHDIIVEDVNAIVRGYNGKAFVSGGPFVYNNQILGGTYRSEVTAFNSRCNFDAPVIHLADLRLADMTSAGGSYHYLVDGVTINGGPHAGLVIHGRSGQIGGLVYLQNNNIMTDARNDMYPTYSGTCYSTSNPYGIACSGLAPGATIYNNTITSGTQYGGNRGILLEGADGTPSNPIIVRKNYVDVHEGPNVEYGDGLPLHALRARYGPGYITIDSNTFIGTGDNNAATDHTGLLVHLVRFSGGTPGATKVIMRHNTMRSVATQNGVESSAITYDAIDYDSLYFTEYNNIKSSGNIYKFGDFNGQSHGQVIEGDTVGFESLTVSPKTYHLGHLSNNFDCAGNVAKDVTYIDGASDTDIHFANSGTEDITLQKTIQVLVRGSNNFAVENANVSIINNYGNVVMNTQTNSAGVAAGPVTYWFESRTSTDSTSYNNFSLVVEKGSDIYTTDLIINASVPTMKVCTLSNTAGEIDSIPPADVDDLSAVPGTAEGSINLSWVAPGDDGANGTASHYIVKYSQSPFDAGSFDAATSAANPPTPVVGGANQNMVLSGLTPGALYYVALKTVDYSDNSSGISNIVSAEAYVDLGSGGEDSTDMYISQGMVPPAGASISSTQPTLSALNILAAGTNNYFFELASDASFSNMISTSGAVTESNSNYTAWQVDQDLSQGQTYFWRVRVNSNPYSQVASFSILATAAANYEPKAYPNPIDFSAGTLVTFDLPSASSDLLITTISGETVLLKSDISGSFQWNGKNEAGGTVAIGQTYLWYVTSEGVTYKGKIAVIG